MNAGKTLSAQIMEFVAWTSFSRMVQRYHGNSGVSTLSYAEQFRATAFAQLACRESLRDSRALGLHGVLAGADEMLDAQMLFDPLEEQLHLPTALVQRTDSQGRKRRFISTPRSLH